MSSNTGDNNDNQLCGDGGGGSSSEEMISSKKECTSCDQNNVENITEDFSSMAILDNMSTCASCGKEGNSDDMNICNKCKTVKYCNAACKKKHRSKHKKACEKRVAELYDEKLFADHPPREECPICFLTLPIEGDESGFKSCCGKVICRGCIHAIRECEGKYLCPFCREPNATSAEEHIKRTKKLMDSGNSEAFNMIAMEYDVGGGVMGLPRDYQRALKLYLQAGELGCARGHYNLGQIYREGKGVEMDVNKAKYYYELAAMKGDVHARQNVAAIEGNAGNWERAKKHLILAAKAGLKLSLDGVKRGFMDGVITKDEYATTLRAYHERQKEMKSDQRDKAAKCEVNHNTLSTST